MMSVERCMGVVGESGEMQRRAGVKPTPGDSVEGGANIEPMAAVSHMGNDTSRVVAAAPRPQIVSRSGPALPFLVQHIAQELMPGAPGLDRYAMAVNAYSRTRDSNLEVLSQGTGLRIRV